jgi:hypothetical protein
VFTMYYEYQGETSDETSMEDIIECVTQGYIQDDTPVWVDGMEAWGTYGEVKNDLDWSHASEPTPVTGALGDGPSISGYLYKKQVRVAFWRAELLRKFRLRNHCAGYARVETGILPDGIQRHRRAAAGLRQRRWRPAYRADRGACLPVAHGRS